MKRIKKIITFILIIIISIFGCGGGTRGSGGGLTFEGVVLTIDGTALSQATVTSIQTGDTAQTDNNGSFVLVTDPFSGEPNFLIEKDTLSVQSSGGVVTKDAKVVSIEIRVKTGEKPSASQTVNVKEKSQSSSSSSSSRSSSSRESSSSSQNSKENEQSDDDSSSSSSSSSSNSSSSEENEDDQNGGGSSSSEHSSSSESSSEKVEVTGNIQSISGSVVTVNSRSFTVNGNTDFDKRDSLSDFSVGEKVEIKGKIISGVLIAEKIKLKD